MKIIDNTISLRSYFRTICEDLFIQVITSAPYGLRNYPSKGSFYSFGNKLSSTKNKLLIFNVEEHQYDIWFEIFEPNEVRIPCNHYEVRIPCNHILTNFRRKSWLRILQRTGQSIDLIEYITPSIEKYESVTGQEVNVIKTEKPIKIVDIGISY